MITVNGTDLSAAGFIYRDRQIPRLHTAGLQYAEIPGTEPIVMGSVQQAATLVVEGAVVRDSHANLLSGIDAVVAALRGVCTIRFSDITDREWIGVLDPTSDVRALVAPQITLGARVSLVFALTSVFARGQSVTQHTGSNPTLSLGTAPSLLNVEVQNGAGSAITQIIVRVRAGGTPLTELQWNGSVASSDLWRLTMDPAWTITNDGANAIDGLTTASEWPIADPAAGATNVQVSITGGSSPVVTTSYRKRW